MASQVSTRKIRELSAGHTSEVDTVSEQDWYRLLEDFHDANIYQTWSYASVICGRRNMSHLVLKRNGNIVAIAQVRISKLPVVNLGIAYVHWGPLWRRGTDTDPDIFRQAVRALRNEFVGKRGLALRIFPGDFDDESHSVSAILAEEGFSSLGDDMRGRTILMDLHPSLTDLRGGMKSHWKRELKVAERNSNEVIEGSGDELFAGFIAIYREMVSRKKFVEPNDIDQFRLIQTRLPEKFKMKIMLAKSGEEVCSGLICSAIGNTAVYLFGATSNAGMRS